MAKPTPVPGSRSPQAVVILGGSEPCQLIWDKAAIYRADEAGVFTTKGIGFARAAKYVWAMLPAAQRASTFPTPEAVAEALPPLDKVWPAIDAAIKAGGEGVAPKNVFGSTSGPSPSSS
jgi:hypothetical protein